MDYINAGTVFGGLLALMGLFMLIGQIQDKEAGELALGGLGMLLLGVVIFSFAWNP